MKSFKILAALAVASTLALSGCQRAEAATLPLDTTLGYVHNSVVDKEGVGLNVGTEVNKFRLGVTSFTSSERLESVGAYAGVPIYVQGTRLGVVPQVHVKRYREASETVGGVGLGLEYKLTPTVRLEGSGVFERGFDNSDVKGEVYTVGLTKTF